LVLRQRRNEVLEAGRRLSFLKQSQQEGCNPVYDETGSVIGMHEALEQRGPRRLRLIDATDEQSKNDAKKP
jgi:hypothetical protein